MVGAQCRAGLNASESGANYLRTSSRLQHSLLNNEASELMPPAGAEPRLAAGVRLGNWPVGQGDRDDGTVVTSGLQGYI